MAQQTIGVGTVANDGTGDALRTAMQKVNANFTELYSTTMVPTSYPTVVSLEGLALVAGDLLYATAADTLTRLAKGTAGQVLTMNVGATAPSWATPSSSSTPVSFAAHKGGVDQTGIASATYTKLTFGTEDWDDGSAFASSAWTPAAGKYAINGAAYVTAGIVDATLFILALYKNGSLFKYLDVHQTGSAGSFNLKGSAIVSASGTDVFELYFYGAGAGTKSVSGAAADTYFQGHPV